MEGNKIFRVLININKQFNIKKYNNNTAFNFFQIKILIKLLATINNGNFTCVFECTIVNLATYRQFTNAACDWIIKKKKTKTKTKQNKRQKKNSKLH